MKKFILPALIVLTTLFFSACSSGDDTTTPNPNLVTKQQVIANYAEIVLQNYQDAYDDAVALQTTLTAFTNDPSETTHNGAKQAWKTARESYGPTEAFRFASGPIDDDNGPEGLLNAWPLDENYIDYVDGGFDSGIINDLTTYPTISKTLLESLNEVGGEANISIGYHAIEFLLWGQDNTSPTDNQAGLRFYTDFVDGGTASNQDRRRQYVNICAELLLDHLQLMLNEWSVGGAYQTTFLALDEDTAIKNMLTGIGKLAKSELAIERIATAYSNQDQEDEHSCFSDNTHRDIRLNLDGIANVYRGQYNTISDASLEDLISQINSSLGAEITAQLASAESALNATAVPFDLAITDSNERPKVLTSVNRLQDLGDKFVEGATVLGINININ